MESLKKAFNKHAQTLIRKLGGPTEAAAFVFAASILPVALFSPGFSNALAIATCGMVAWNGIRALRKPEPPQNGNDVPPAPRAL